MLELGKIVAAKFSRDGDRLSPPPTIFEIELENFFHVMQSEGDCSHLIVHLLTEQSLEGYDYRIAGFPKSHSLDDLKYSLASLRENGQTPVVVLDLSGSFQAQWPPEHIGQITHPRDLINRPLISLCAGGNVIIGPWARQSQQRAPA